MVWVIEKRRLFTSALCICSLACAVLVFWTGVRLSASTVSAFAPAERGRVTWIVDAGHGGEDGGAVSKDGVTESRLNLEIAFRVNDLLRFAGERTVLSRSGEEGLHTEGNTIRARKGSDIRNRVALVNEAENGVLVSIHQNSLPSSPVTHGAQVFWNRREGGEALAYLVQDSLNAVVNTGREKQPRRIADTIYLMKHVTVPAVLVECGFLSNAEETALLQDPSHQTILAAAITAGCLRCLAGEELP